MRIASEPPPRSSPILVEETPPPRLSLLEYQRERSQSIGVQRSSKGLSRPMIREKLGHKQRTVSERRHYTISGETPRLVPLGKKQVTLGIDSP